jgi:acetyl-CoA C-acetyltransferase
MGTDQPPDGSRLVACKTMPLDPRTPVIVGVGQVTHRAEGLDDAREPVDLMAEAVARAASDAKLGGVPAADVVRVVNLLTWPYRDPAHFLAARLGVSPRETGYTTPGGNTPQTLVNLTALEIQRGELEVAILAGGEAWRTRQRAQRAGATITWDKLPRDATPGRVLGSDLEMSAPEEQARGIFMPVQLYPMFESALRGVSGASPDEHLAHIAELWSRFSLVAATNPHAWIQDAKSPVEIRTPGPDNRMIGLPYTKYMNSNNDVDMAAALLICSAEAAQRLDVPEERWVFPHAGTDCREIPFVSHRVGFADAPAVRIGGQTVLELAGIGIDDVDVIDLYSCFPSAVQAGAAALGVGLERQLTRTGGLSFAGGPWNNYVMHAIATVVGDLRERPGAHGLVWGNGGFLTKHSFGVYASTPPASGFRHAQPQDEIDRLPRRELAAPEEASGPAVVEAYTVMHDRDGDPEMAIASCLLRDGRRAWGTSSDAGLARAMCDGEWVGRAITLDHAGAVVDA